MEPPIFLKRMTGIQSRPIPDMHFTPDEQQILTNITSISEFPTADPVTAELETSKLEPILKGYLDWYIGHLRSRLDNETAGFSLPRALQPHLTNTSVVDMRLEQILSLFSKALADPRGGQSIRRIHEDLLCVQEDSQPANLNPTVGGDLGSNSPPASLAGSLIADDDLKRKLEGSSPIIFKVIGEMTMLFTTPPIRSVVGAYTPPTTTPSLQLSLAYPPGSTSNLRSKAISCTMCPFTEEIAQVRLKTLLRRFGQFLPPWIPDNNPASLRFGDTLFSGNLSYEAMLRTARIKIAWVDSFPLHLEFDARTVTLKIFRFPTFCAMMAHPRSSNSQFFDRLLNDQSLSDVELSQRPDAERSPIAQDFWVELLCTYRLIFGQHSYRTHKLYRKNDPASVGLVGEDPLLHDLCGNRSKGNKHLEAIDAFPEKLLYSAESDFPVFGDRLLTLQNYITAQSPNSIKALWYDRRDIHRFWTFWAVIIFGALSIVLSVIQTVLGGVQVHYAKKEGPGG